MAFAFPVFNMERLAGVRSIFSAKSPSEIFRFSTLEAICRELDCQPGDILEYREEDE
jgi:hypothetical protein